MRAAPVRGMMAEDPDSAVMMRPVPATSDRAVLHRRHAYEECSCDAYRP